MVMLRDKNYYHSANVDIINDGRVQNDLKNLGQVDVIGEVPEGKAVRLER